MITLLRFGTIIAALNVALIASSFARAWPIETPDFFLGDFRIEEKCADKEGRHLRYRRGDVILGTTYSRHFYNHAEIGDVVRLTAHRAMLVRGDRVIATAFPDAPGYLLWYGMFILSCLPALAWFPREAIMRHRSLRGLIVGSECLSIVVLAFVVFVSWLSTRGHCV